MDSGKNGQNHGHHVKEHLSINKSRGDYFFKIFSYFGDSIWDMLLREISFPEKSLMAQFAFSEDLLV